MTATTTANATTGGTAGAARAAVASSSSSLTARQSFQPFDQTISLTLGSISSMMMMTMESSPTKMECSTFESTESTKSTKLTSALSYSLSTPAMSSTAWHVCFSKDGRFLAACFGVPTPCVKIWRVATRNSDDDEDDRDNEDEDEDEELSSSIRFEQEPIATLEMHERTVRWCDFAPTFLPPQRQQLPVLATASFDGTVCLWEPCSNETNNIKNGDDINSPLPSWDCALQLEGHHENEVKCVCWNRSGTLLATCGRDKTVWIWSILLPGAVGGGDEIELGDGEEECMAVLTDHEGDVKRIAFCPSHGQWGDGDEILLSASYDGTVRCWAQEENYDDDDDGGGSGGDWYCAMVVWDGGPSQHPRTVWDLSVSLSGRRLVAAFDDGSLAIFHALTIEEEEARNKEDVNNENSGGGRRGRPRRSRAITTSHGRRRRHGSWKCVGMLPHAHGKRGRSMTASSSSQRHRRRFRNDTEEDVEDDHDDSPYFATTVYSVDCAPSRGSIGHENIMASVGADRRLHIYREVQVESASEATATDDDDDDVATTPPPPSRNDRPQFVLEASSSASSSELHSVCFHPFHGNVLATASADGTISLWNYRHRPSSSSS